MLTLLSSNEELAYIIFNSVGYHLENNNLLVITSHEDIKEAEIWLEENDVGSVYFDPNGEVFGLNDFKIESRMAKDEEIGFGIVFYNDGV